MAFIYNENQLRDISTRFHIYGEILHAEACKIGHINETYTATYGQGGNEVRYIHQKINGNVFKKPVQVMENVNRVTQHIRKKLVDMGEDHVTRRVLIIIPARDGKCYYRDPEGHYWRTFVFIENIRTYESVGSSNQAFQAGKAFGKFVHFLADMKNPRLHETIPSFHNVRQRFETFLEALDQDRFNRASPISKEIDFFKRKEGIVRKLEKAIQSGGIPERITHNDTKFNNVLLDIETGKEQCVVDLDTVMPGNILYDFGDMVRTTTSPTMEDELDLSKVRVRMPLFKSLAKGYLEATREMLTKKEKQMIAFSGKLMTFTIGLRFLTDYLSGDTYFRVHRPEHNLDRTRTQIKLVQSIEHQEEKMQAFVDGL
ncbi:MAG: aminoglycoside phosphotransferase family protein [Verrucomicrobiota bacterium]|nr:aminoglycoside phosphotransferase family protein [Verrucomicrobiota bacterium]